MLTLPLSAFHDVGGWVVDMISGAGESKDHLLAHGLGVPVADALGAVDGCAGGQFRLWAWTRDWVAPHGPGRFQVLVNGIAAEKVFGVGSGEWGWVDGGIVALHKGRNEVRLHDLTGFDGRCGGIAFSDVNATAEEVERAWLENDKRIYDNREVLDFDFVVVGGGYAGMCSAVAAARDGVNTALVQDRPVWGGNASSEVRVGPIGGLGLEPFPHNSDLAYELIELTHVKGKSTSGGLRPLIDDNKICDWLAQESNLTTFISTRCVDCEVQDGVIESVICKVGRRVPTPPHCGRAPRPAEFYAGRYVELKAKHFADCTGDAVLAVLAGAEYRDKPETKAETGEELATEGESKGGYGSTNFWTTRWISHPTTFPSCPWALNITDENWQVNRPKFFVEGDYPYAAGWNWESGFDKDPVKDAEWIRDYNLRAAYGMWDYLKNKASDKAKYSNAEMDWLGYVLGKRAARRIVGDYVLCEQDLTQHRVYDDGVVTTTWFLDLHFPHPMNACHFPEGAFRSMAYDDPMYDKLASNGKGRQIKIRPYPIPFRCFYSRNIKNLWMAGKDISCTNVAMSSVRVMNTTAQMGAMVGRAVALCVKQGWMPKELGDKHFKTLADSLKCKRQFPRLGKHGKKRYQGRIGLKGELKYWLRPLVRMLRRMIATS